MSEPIFILGCHRSGTSVVAGLLHNACGVSMGELMPPTEDNPMGYFEALGVVDAHRDLLSQMERDWTCPPSTFRPGRLDLTALQEQIDIHKQLPGVWAMKDPRSMFLLPAWSHLGLNTVRLIGVARAPADTVRSIEKRDDIRQDRAEAIVDTYLRRLGEIADRVPLPIIQFPGQGDSFIHEVREVAAALDLPWDEEAARAFFDERLVRNRSPLRDTTPTFEALIAKARRPKNVPAINLNSLKLSSEPRWPLETHLGVRHAQQRNELWEMADFSTTPNPEVVEILLDGARAGGKPRPGVTLHQISVRSPLTAGATMMRERLRPDGIIAHGLLAGRTIAELEFFFRSLYITSSPLAELLVDTADPNGQGILGVTPPPLDHPRPSRVQEVAGRCGWDHVVAQRLSPGRSGILLRKRVLTDHELIPVVTDLINNIQRMHDLETRLGEVEEKLEHSGIKPRGASGGPVSHASIESERKRADDAERDLARLRNRRSVRLALWMSSLARPLFRTVRSWKKSH